MPALTTDVTLDQFLDQVFGSIPLLFIREFLRVQKQRSRKILIGTTRKEVRANLRDAIVSHLLSREELAEWFGSVEGWGKQHLYLLKTGRRALMQNHLLNTKHLNSFLKARGIARAIKPGQEPESPHVLADSFVDDELAQLSWRSHSVGLERREELDEVRELEDGEYEFRAFRRLPKRSASRLVIRKVDGIVLVLVDLPLGEDHESMRGTVEGIANTILSPAIPVPIALSPIVQALDGRAVASYGSRPTRAVDLNVAPTQARYRTDGARVDFASTRHSTSYADSDPVRRVRKAMQVESFEGEFGRFRLTFEGKNREPHDMIVSLHAGENRIFLFSRMAQSEVFSLVDQLLTRG